MTVSRCRLILIWALLFIFTEWSIPSILSKRGTTFLKEAAVWFLKELCRIEIGVSFGRGAMRLDSRNIGPFSSGNDIFTFLSFACKDGRSRLVLVPSLTSSKIPVISIELREVLVVFPVLPTYVSNLSCVTLLRSSIIFLSFLYTFLVIILICFLIS
jgi:hypothetical protein